MLYTIYLRFDFALTPNIPPIAPLNTVTKSFVTAKTPILDENASDARSITVYIVNPLIPPTNIPCSLRLFAEIKPAINEPITSAHVDICPITENGISVLLIINENINSIIFIAIKPITTALSMLDKFLGNIPCAFEDFGDVCFGSLDFIVFPPKLAHIKAYSEISSNITVKAN